MSKRGPPDWQIEWRDHGREPQCQPNPNYPEGIDIDLSNGFPPACESPLAYPAPRCGAYVIRCRTCGLKMTLTTAGRPDDPRSLKVTCWRKLQ